MVARRCLLDHLIRPLRPQHPTRRVGLATEKATFRLKHENDRANFAGRRNRYPVTSPRNR